MSSYESQGTGYREVTGWTGWVVFAAVVMMVNGSFNAIQGLSALLRDEAYWVTNGGEVLTFDITGWGWIHLILGIVTVIVGFMLLQGSTFARVIAIGLVCLNLIAQFAYLPIFPFWGIVAIAVSFFVLYALIVHGGELKS
jgi:hypothetical protein